jgi:hypothetical protein
MTASSYALEFPWQKRLPTSPVAPPWDTAPASAAVCPPWDTAPASATVCSPGTRHRRQRWSAPPDTASTSATVYPTWSTTQVSPPCIKTMASKNKSAKWAHQEHTAFDSVFGVVNLHYIAITKRLQKKSALCRKIILALHFSDIVCAFLNLP